MDEHGKMDFEDVVDHYHKYGELPDTKHNHIPDQKLKVWTRFFQEHVIALTNERKSWIEDEFFARFKMELFKEYMKRKGWDK